MIYLDHAASTPLDPSVLEAMQPHLRDTWGNPSSPHSKGREARIAVDAARQSVANSLGVKPQEVVFVSSGSEASTLAVLGVCSAWRKKHGKCGHLVVSSIEHKCVMESAKHLEHEGWTVTWLPVDKQGRINPGDVNDAIKEDTALVSVMWANNEIGTIQPIEEILQICSQQKVPFHCDAVQAIGYLPLPSSLPNLLTIAGHKIYGPKGSAVLIIKEGTQLEPLIFGGDHEGGLRAGTEDTASIVGFAKALELTIAEQPKRKKHAEELREQLESNLPDTVTVSASETDRVPHITSLHTPGRRGDMLVIKLDEAGIAVSTGAACSTGAADASYVLQAMGQSEEQAKESVRISTGTMSTQHHIDAVVGALTL